LKIGVFVIKRRGGGDFLKNDKIAKKLHENENFGEFSKKGSVKIFWTSKFVKRS